jgi:hypothetical protein
MAAADAEITGALGQLAEQGAAARDGFRPRGARLRTFADVIALTGHTDDETLAL